MNRPRYDEPFHWWGPGWDAPAPLNIGDVLRDGTLDPWIGANLWAALARRMSAAVAAGPSGAGKTTLLTALLGFLPPATRRIYLRGSFETFAFLTDASVVPGASVLLVNEISPHLPVYLWGPAVTRSLSATDRGFAILATAHAGSVAEFVGLLTGSPLRIPAPLVAAFEFVVFLEPSPASPSGRRVRELTRLTRTAGGIAYESMPALPVGGANRPTASGLPERHPWFPDEELRQRRQILDNLRHGVIDALPPWAPLP